MTVKTTTLKHPQEAIHSSSLIRGGDRHRDDNSPDTDNEAQLFWLNASKGLKWFRRPTVVSEYALLRVEGSQIKI